MNIIAHEQFFHSQKITQFIARSTLHNADLIYAVIAQRLDCTQRQIQHTCQTSRFTLKNRSERSMKLSQSQQEELIEFIIKDDRRYFYLQLSCIFNRWDVEAYAIRFALRKAHFKRYVTRTKSSLSKKISAKGSNELWSIAIEHMRNELRFFESMKPELLRNVIFKYEWLVEKRKS